MYRIVLSLFFIAFIVIAGTVMAEPRGQGKEGAVPAYDPLIVYPGDYQADALLFRNPGTMVWQTIPRLERLQNVSCKDALDHLTGEGKWQGHLRPDGSCGSRAEPSDWIMGNRLNFEDALAQEAP
jgi:hypothetical protein